MTPRSGMFAENRLLSITSLSCALFPLTLCLLAVGLTPAFHYIDTDTLNAAVQFELYKKDALVCEFFGKLSLDSASRMHPCRRWVPFISPSYHHVSYHHVTRRAFFLGSCSFSVLYLFPEREPHP